MREIRKVNWGGAFAELNYSEARNGRKRKEDCFP